MKTDFERTLPDGYREAFHIDARNKKTGLLLSLVSFIPLVLMIAIFVLTLNGKEVFPSVPEESDDPSAFFAFPLFTLALLGGIVLYMVLHELVHGIVYKAKTGEKLTFGLSWSCAFCGVPNVYVYRKTAIQALMAPFVVFTLLLLPLTVVCYFVNAYLYVLFGILLAMHLGGCCGDLYMFFLLKFRFKDETSLMRDTGPEQWLYVK